MPVTLVTPPTDEPIGIDEAKAHLVVEHADDDGRIAGRLIPAVRQRCEQETLRSLMKATFDLTLDRVCGSSLVLPYPPLRAVTSVKYYDLDGVLQTWATSNYTVSAPYAPRGRRGRIHLGSGLSWPTLQDRPEALVIRYVAGYVDPSIDPDDPSVAGQSIPDLLIVGMLQDLEALYAHETADLPEGVKRIYRAYVSR